MKDNKLQTQMENLRVKIDKLQYSMDNLVEIDCSVCKHLTLAKKTIQFSSSGPLAYVHAVPPEIPIRILFICYTCGNKFAQEKTEIMRKIEDESKQ